MKGALAKDHGSGSYIQTRKSFNRLHWANKEWWGTKRHSKSWRDFPQYIDCAKGYEENFLLNHRNVKTKHPKKLWLLHVCSCWDDWDCSIQRQASSQTKENPKSTCEHALGSAWHLWHLARSWSSYHHLHHHGRLHQTTSRGSQS